MSDFTDNLWAQFAIETREHIEAIELDLVEAEQSGATPELISRLFRSFHSLKGLAAAMDMKSFARIAHRAEDILGVIREGEFPLNSDVTSLLLEALDGIKKARQYAVTAQVNAAEDPELLGHLSETFGRIVPRSSPAENPPAGSPASLVLQADPEMLAYFIELARDKIAVISRVLQPSCSPTGSEQPPADGDGLELVATAIDELAFAARIMELTNLIETLNHLRLLLPTAGPADTADQTALTNCLIVLHDQIRYIESSSGNADAGADTLHTILTEAMLVNIRGIFTIVLDQLEQLQHSDRESGPDLSLVQAVHVSLSTLNSHLAFFMSKVNCTIILVLLDVYSRASRGELPVVEEIVEMTKEEILRIMEHYRDCSAGTRCLREGSGELAEVIQRLHDYVWSCESGCSANNPLEVIRQFMAELNIEPELLRMLSPQNVRDLMQALEKGENIYEMSVHLESNEELAAGFLAWIESSRSRIITNRSVFIEQQSWYNMLLISPLPYPEFRRQLAVIDPHGSCLLLKADERGIPKKEKLLKALDEIPPPARPAAPDTAGSVIRVPMERLDSFMNLIGELVLARGRLNHAIHGKQLDLVIARLKHIRDDSCAESAGLLYLLEEHRRELLEADRLLQTSLGHLQASALGLRVVPVDMVFRRLPRVVRDLALQQGKKIRLEMSGQEVKIDKAMVEVLTDPLLHIVRNSVDHGSETPEARARAGKPAEAVVRVSAVQRGSSIVLEISDDGRGIDAGQVLSKAVGQGLVSEASGRALPRAELLRFIFQPGFSTAPVVTETSGRGVGLDVVMTNVVHLGGTISVASEPGQGTTFTLRVPLSAAIQEVLLVAASGQLLALPVRYVAEVLEFGAADLQTVRGDPAILLRGDFLPVHQLAALLGYAAPELPPDRCMIVVLTNGTQKLGLLVESVVQRQELFIKEVQSEVTALPGVGGASVLGNGKIVLILDGEDLLRIAKAGCRAADV